MQDQAKLMSFYPDIKKDTELEIKEDHGKRLKTIQTDSL